MAKLLHKVLPVVWTWQKSCPGMAFFRHRCPTLVSPWHGDRGDSKDLWKRETHQQPKKLLEELFPHWQVTGCTLR